MLRNTCNPKENQPAGGDNTLIDMKQRIMPDTVKPLSEYAKGAEA